MHRPLLGAALAAVLLLATGCSSEDDSPSRVTSPDASGSATEGSSKESAPPAHGSAKVVRTVTENLKSPWGLVELPDGKGLLVSSRDEGTISRIDTESGKVTEVGEVPGVAAEGEGGLLGLAVSPDYASDHMVYAYLTTASDNRIVRMMYDPEKPAGSRLGAPSTLLRGIPKGTTHNGGRLAFGPDKLLYAATGESGEEGLAQDKESLGGKILRLTPDGDPAPGNPFGDDSPVWSMGHRNVQGLAWDRERRLWATEFGQDTWDEVNLITRGGNYGWPEVEGKEGDGDKRFTAPVAQWTTDEASPSGLAFTNGSLWMAGLGGERLWRIPLLGERPSAEPEAFLEEKYGRLRTVLDGPAGKIWLLTSETDGRGSPGKGDDRLLELEVE